MRFASASAAGALLAACVWMAPAAQAQSTDARDILRQLLREAPQEFTGLQLPANEAFTTGDRDVAAGQTAKGTIAVIGTARIAGTVDGDVFSYTGDVVIMDGAHVTGSVVAINGRVRLEGGVVDGDVRSIAGAMRPGVPPSRANTMSENVALTFGWAAVVLVIGIGVLVFGGPTLDAVGTTADQQFGRSFLVGLGATLAIVPVLCLVCIALALTILGILLIPFAIVAYILAVMGLVALGFIAVVRMTGQSFSRSRSGSTSGERSAAVRALVLGTAFYVALWLVGALTTPFDGLAGAVRVVAFAITWAAATVGLGATIISRAGTRPAGVPVRADAFAGSVPYQAVAPAVVSSWQTPTPVTGVVAARRPASTPNGSS